MQARKSERTVCSVYARENCAENHLSAHAGLQRCMQMEKMAMAESVRGIPEVAHSGAPPVLHGGHGRCQIRGRDPVPCTGIFRQIGLPASFGNDRNGKTYRAGRDFASFSGRVKHPGTPEKREWATRVRVLDGFSPEWRLILWGVPADSAGHAVPGMPQSVFTIR